MISEERINEAIKAMDRLKDPEYRYSSYDGVYDDLRIVDGVLRKIANCGGVATNAQEIIKERRQ